MATGKQGRLLRAWPWIAVAIVALLASEAVRGQPAEADDWKFDVIHLRNGGKLSGLVVKETSQSVLFWRVSRKPGASTTVISATIERKEIDHIDSLDEKNREILSARLKALDPTGKGEVRRMANLVLKAGDWGKNGKGQAHIYRSEYFVLESNAPEDVVRRAAVRLENVYTAYTRYLAPRVESAEPTRILLARSLPDYQALLRDERQPAVQNPALYDPSRNQICCGSDLQRLGEDLEKIRGEHQRALADLNAKENELFKLYKGKIPTQFLNPIRESRSRIALQDDRNERLFQEATSHLFQRLTHEAFHAYLASFVYSPSDAEVPRWLNEGLAQIFETAIIEAGELRAGHPDRTRLRRVQTMLNKGDFLAVADLLKSGPKQFLVQHATDQQASDRHYLASWALAYYLTFERRLLAGKAMDEYVRALHRGGDPLVAFREFVGQPLPEFEKEYRRFMERLPAGK
jgi:hypothetical protein